MISTDIIKYNILCFLNTTEKCLFSRVNKNFNRFLKIQLEREFVVWLRSGKLVGKDLRQKSYLIKECLYEEHNFVVDLSNVNLSGTDLSDIDMSSCILRYTNLEGCNLDHSSLYSADMSFSNLKECSIKNSNLVGTWFQNAEFENTDFTDSDLTYANLEGTNTTKAFLFGAILYKTSI